MVGGIVTTKIDLYYWSDQCPNNSLVRNLLYKLMCKGKYDISFYDVSKEYDIAKRMNMYSPTLVVFDNKIRWNGPISLSIIQSIAEGNIPENKPYKVDLGKHIIKGNVEMLTEKNIFDTCICCAPSQKTSCCYSKSEWIKQIRKEFNLPYLGVLHYYNNKCVGGAEFVPSLAVPYPIIKGKDIAFLTCSYLSGEEHDFRSYPLKKLEEKLSSLNYKSLVAIVSEDVVFPNETLNWFKEKGYIDLGEVYYEERDFARMHLIKKDLY